MVLWEIFCCSHFFLFNFDFLWDYETKRKRLHFWNYRCQGKCLRLFFPSKKFRIFFFLLLRHSGFISKKYFNLFSVDFNIFAHWDERLHWKKNITRHNIDGSARLSNNRWAAINEDVAVARSVASQLAKVRRSMCIVYGVECRLVCVTTMCVHVLRAERWWYRVAPPTFAMLIGVL